MNPTIFMMAFLGEPESFPWHAIVWPLVGLLTVVVVTGFGIGYAVSRHLDRTRLMIRRRRREMPDWHPDPAMPALLASPFRWLAVRSANLHLVQAALGLRNPRPCSWEEGLTRSQDNKLFLSPPVDGWILVMGGGLPDPADDVDKCFRFIIELSRQIGQVQFFSLNRIVSHHAWVLADQGRVVRAYAWAGRTVWNQGKPTDAERRLQLCCFDYGEIPVRNDFTKLDPAAANTEKVPLLAARWSVDPMTVDARSLREGRGIAGKLSSSRPH